MNDWWKTASATFAGGAVAIGLVAIPTFVWLPREFDEIRADLDENSRISSGVAAQIAQSAVVSEQISTNIDRLTIAIAEVNAEAVGFRGGSKLSVYSPEFLSELLPNRERFLALLPSDVGQSLESAGQLAAFKYSYFDSRDWVFVDRADFNGLEASTQNAVMEAFNRQEVVFTVLP